MNEAMKQAWLEISRMLGEPTREELDVFLRTWQRASQATREALAEQPAQRTDDTKRLNALAENSWDLRCFDMPTGAGDADIGWRVVEHHMVKPHKRTVAEVFRDDPRQAIDDAIAAAHGIKENT